MKIFHALPPEEIVTLIPHAKFAQFTAGEAVFRQGGQGEDLCGTIVGLSTLAGFLTTLGVKVGVIEPEAPPRRAAI